MLMQADSIGHVDEFRGSIPRDRGRGGGGRLAWDTRMGMLPIFLVGIAFVPQASSGAQRGVTPQTAAQSCKHGPGIQALVTSAMRLRGGWGGGGHQGTSASIAAPPLHGTAVKDAADSRGQRGANDCKDIIEAKDMHELAAAISGGCGAERTAQAYHRLKALIAAGSVQQQPHVLPVLLATLSDHAVAHVYSFKPRHLGMILNAYAALGRSPSPALLNALQNQAVSLASSFDEWGTSNTVWAFAKFGTIPSPALIDALTLRAIDIMETYAPQAIANTLWGHAALGVPPSRGLLEAMSAQAALKAPEMNPQNLANIMWSFGSLRRRPGRALQNAFEHRCCETMGDFTPQAISNLLWGHASFGVPPGAGLLRAVGARTVETCSNFTAQAISNALWGYATLELHPAGDVLAALSEQAGRKMTEFTPQNLANTLWALASLSWMPSGTLMRRLVEQCLSQMHDFNPQDVANVVCGHAKLGVPLQGTLLASLEAQACERAKEFTTQGISNILWGLATLCVNPRGALVSRLEDRACEVMDHFRSQEISNVIWSYGVFGVPPEPRMLAVVEARLCRVLHSFPAQAIGNSLWGYAAMGAFPSEEVLVKSCNRMLALLAGEAGENVGGMTRRQTDQFCLAFELEGQCERYSRDVFDLIQVLKHSAREGVPLEKSAATVSRMQSEVAECLRGLGSEVLEEVMDSATGCSVDLVLQTACGKSIAIEVDGPSHFLRGTQNLTGATAMKRRHLAKAGGYAAVLSVPFWEWEAANSSPGGRGRYLTKLLHDGSSSATKHRLGFKAGTA